MLTASTDRFAFVEKQGSRGYLIGVLAALGIHAAILFGIPRAKETFVPPEFGVEVAAPGVEVTLVAALPAEIVEEAASETPEAVAPPEPEPEPIPPEEPPKPEEPEPEPEPIPEPTPEPAVVPETPPEMTVPEPTPAATPAPTPVKPAAQPKPKPKRPRPIRKPQAAAPKAKRTARASGDGSSAVPGNDAISATASRGALSAQPGYLRNPHPAYPEEARKAGQEGVVFLRVSVNERGKVTNVVLSRSSGHPLLDERALSTVRDKWVFKPARSGKTSVATEVVIPIRFTLD